MVEPSVQSRCGTSFGQRTCWPSRERRHLVSHRGEALPVEADDDRVVARRGARGSSRARRSAAARRSMSSSRTSTRPTTPTTAVDRERIPARSRERADVDGHRAASEAWIDCGQRPAPSSAGSSSSCSPKTSATASTAAGRTSSTASGPLELARHRRELRVLEPARGDPLRERRGIEVDVERVPVRRHPARDVDADRRDLPRALPAAGGIHTPVRPS